MSTNACPKECPICMDDIMEVNFVITECGHTFHTSCLMKNAAHNGFGCPYCRAVMAEVPEDDDEDESSIEEDDDSSSEEEEEEEEEEPFSNDSLSGMRWLFLSAENPPLSEDDEEEDDEEEDDEEEELPTPTSELVAQKLLEENITFQDLVISLLAINHEEYENKEEYQKKEDEVYDKIQIIISNFRTPLQEPAEPILEQQVQEEEKPILQTQIQEKETIPEVKVEEVIPNKIDFSAQPKERKNKKLMFENSLL